MDQVKFVETAFKKFEVKADYIALNFLKAVFHKFHLVADHITSNFSINFACLEYFTVASKEWCHTQLISKTDLNLFTIIKV